MSDESMEVEVTETETPEIKSDEKVKETETQEPSNTDEEVKEKTEEKKPELTEAEKKAYALEKRLHRKTAQEKALQEQIDALTEQVEKYKPKDVDDTPKEDDFETYEEWQDAIVEHKANKRLEELSRQEKQKQLQAKQREQFEKRQKAFQENELKFKAEHPEYDANAEQFLEYSDDLKASKGANNPTLTTIGQILAEVETAPVLINHLGQNEDLVYELADMSPVNAAFKMFEIQQQLTRTSPDVENEKPAPVKSLKGTGKPSKSLGQKSGKEVLQWLNT